MQKAAEENSRAVCDSVAVAAATFCGINFCNFHNVLSAFSDLYDTREVAR